VTHGIGSEESIRASLEAEEAEIQRGVDFMNSNVGRAVASTISERVGEKIVFVSTPTGLNK